MSICLAGWQLFSCSTSGCMSRKNRGQLRPDVTETKPSGWSLKSFGQICLSLLSIAMIKHSDQKQSGKEKGLAG